jgi:protease stability complex PrcB-like protein
MMLIVAVLAALLQTPPPVRTVGKGAMSAIDAPRQVVVRTTSEWADLWKAHGGAGSPPAVDFSREMVVGLFLGTKPTAGYNVQIVRTVGNADVVMVEYVETSPGRGALTAQVLTAPYHLAAVPRHDGEVRFQKVEK